VTPVVAVVLGMLVLGEDLSWRTVAGGIMIMVGVRFVTRISSSVR
jgi:drug/metabolite transporter (DMT)-like permease